MPPPQVGMGENELFPTPVVPPGTGIDAPEQPQFGSGDAATPTAADFFPAFTAAGPFQPIVLTALMQIGLGPPPTTPGTQPVTVSSAPSIPQLPWTPASGVVEPAAAPASADVPHPHPKPKPAHKRKHKAHHA
jgi:hypothetical protein